MTNDLIERLRAALSRAVNDHADALATIASMKAERAEALREAKQLAEALHRRHYFHVKHWKPLDTTAAIISQIDNMTAGIGSNLEAREAEITRYRSELTKIHKLVPGHIAGEIAWAALTGKDEAS